MYDYQSLQRNIEAYKRDLDREHLRERPEYLDTSEFMSRPLRDEDADPLIMDLNDSKCRHIWVWSD